MAETTDKKAATKTTTKKRAPRKKVAKATDNPVFRKIKQENDRFSQAVEQIMTQYREFTVPGEKGDRVLRVYNPSPEVESLVNQTYSKTYGRLLQDDDFLPEEQIMDNLKKRGVWSDEKDDRIKALVERQTRLRNLIRS